MDREAAEDPMSFVEVQYEFLDDEDAATARTGVSQSDEEMELLQSDVELRSIVLDTVARGIPNLRTQDSILSGEVTRTMEGASQLTLTVHDLGREILESEVLQNDSGLLRAIDLKIDGLFYRLTKIAKSGDDLNLTLEDRDVAWLRLLLGPRKGADRAKVTRAMYILQLIRAVRQRKIPVEINELKVKQPIKGATAKDKDKIRNRRRSKGFDRGIRLRGKEGLLNQAQLNNAARGLAVCEGLNSPDLATLAWIVAALVEAPDFDNPKDGEGTSVGMLQLTDIHGLSEEKRRDIEYVTKRFMSGPAFAGAQKENPKALGAIGLARLHPKWTPGKIAQIIQGSAYPARYDKYRARAKLILKEWGGTGGSASLFKRFVFRVDKKETYWDAIQRLAAEVGWRAFFSGGRFYYISEEDLLKSEPRYRFSESTPGISNIDFEWDYRKAVAKATVACRIDRWGAPPGTVVIVEGLGPASVNPWLVGSIQRNLFSAEATINLTQPMKELEEPRPEVQESGSGANSGQGPGGPLFDICKQFSGSYQYGGGHGPLLKDMRIDQPMDCSSSCSLALYRANKFGARNRALSSGDFSGVGKPGKGDDFTIWYTGGHMYIEFHGAHAGWRFDTSPHSGDKPSSRGPRLRKGRRSSSGFSARHVS